MEVKNIDIKGIPTAEFNDNEYLENYLKELEANGVNVILSKLDDLINWVVLILFGHLFMLQVVVVLNLWLQLLLITTFHVLVWR